MRTTRALVIPIELNKWFRFSCGPYSFVNLSDIRAFNVTDKYRHAGRAVPRTPDRARTRTYPIGGVRRRASLPYRA